MNKIYNKQAYMGIGESISGIRTQKEVHEAKALFKEMIQENAYVGDLFSINYETTCIQIHDSYSTPLPQDQEAIKIRVETSQRVSGEISHHWDSDGAMNAKTRVLLGYAGVECRIIGTFFLEKNPNNSEAPLILSFGSDISNYYPNRGLKVYKPHSKALKMIVNYRSAFAIKEQLETFKTSSTEILNKHS